MQMSRSQEAGQVDETEKHSTESRNRSNAIKIKAFARQNGRYLK